VSALQEQADSLRSPVKHVIIVFLYSATQAKTLVKMTIKDLAFNGMQYTCFRGLFAAYSEGTVRTHFVLELLSCKVAISRKTARSREHLLIAEVPADDVDTISKHGEVLQTRSILAETGQSKQDPEGAFVRVSTKQ